MAPEVQGQRDIVVAVDELAVIRQTRDRIRAAIPTPDHRSGLLTGGSLSLTLIAWLLLAPPPTVPFGVLAACAVAHAFASLVEFEIGPGSAVPTMPVLVVTLFLIPPQLVPFVPIVGLATAAAVAHLRDPARHERPSVLVGSAWHAVGPALVFWVAGVTGPSAGSLGVYAVALVAQFAFDAASSWVRNCYGLGVSTSRLSGALRFTFLADLLLAPIGLAAALALPHSPAALVFVVPPILLLSMLQRDRRQHISRAVVLSEAVTRTAEGARRDALTRLRNRLAWEEALAEYRDWPLPIGVVLADVDGLKAANDVFGHDAGDRLLIAVARLIARATPAHGKAVAARLGGDEFGILLPGALASRAEEVARGLRAALAAAPRFPDGPAVSASIGFGVASSGAALGTAFVEADRGVYEDKHGRSKSRR